MTTADLKPCPFCSDSGYFYDVELTSGSYEDAIKCGDCGAMTASFDTREKAIEAWNRRAGESQGRALVN